MYQDSLGVLMFSCCSFHVAIHYYSLIVNDKLSAINPLSSSHPCRFPCSPAKLQHEMCFELRSSMVQFFFKCWWLLSWLRNFLSFMECEVSLDCSQGLLFDPLLKLLKIVAHFKIFLLHRTWIVLNSLYCSCRNVPAAVLWRICKASGMLRSVDWYIFTGALHKIFLSETSVCVQ
jgi:hypothetical protein